MSANLTSATLGYPRIGRNREMKKGLESYWSSLVSEATLRAISESVLSDALATQSNARVDKIAVGDHTLYDHILDWTVRLGCVPPRFAGMEGLYAYFAMARGVEEVTALDMSKFFDTNYHYLVPELDQSTKPTGEFEDFWKMLDTAEEKIEKERIVPVVFGPVTYVKIARLDRINKEEMLERLLPVYKELLDAIKKKGYREVQMHEPALVMGDAGELRGLYEAAYKSIGEVGIGLDLVTYFDDLEDSVFEWASKLKGLCSMSLDFTRGGNLEMLRRVGFPKTLRLGAGIVDGRSVWNDVDTACSVLNEIRRTVGEEVVISIQPSCSLQFIPIDVEIEDRLPQDIQGKLSFAIQKLRTIAALANTVLEGEKKCETEAIINDTIADSFDEGLFHRKESFAERRPLQFTVPGGFGTTTIGSFPPSAKVRKLRWLCKGGQVQESLYFDAVDKEIEEAVRIQEELGLDVFVHGEPERSDMVEYFGVKLSGIAFSAKGWVQSYGSRYVRPPVIYADVSRTGPITVREFKVAQAKTSKPVKGMLTAATTILNWSFPRRDVSRKIQAYQIALALRDEVQDLENAGCEIIQVDDPALREGLPLKQKHWANYLDWAVRAFRLSTSGVKPSTQIVTHLCYANFEDILGAIDEMQADVLAIENSRSGDEMLRALAGYGYSRDIGPGVYDIHSPVVPKASTMLNRIKSFTDCGLSPERLWVNPDCGLKTRKWSEVKPALANMVSAAIAARHGKAI